MPAPKTTRPDLRDPLLAGPPADAWRIVERGRSPERMAALESVFSVGNGSLGLRGTPEEGTPAHDPGTVLNGMHETWPIVYP
jgi:alpha,alpha-trehalose phosphorylase